MKLFLFFATVCLPLFLPSFPNGICTLQHSELQDRWRMLSIYFYLNTKKTQQSLLMTKTHSSLLIHDNFVQWLYQEVNSYRDTAGSQLDCDSERKEFLITESV